MNIKQIVRRRDAAATRTAILNSARTLFARDSYENVGIRCIAAQAGVDSALVSRYFGSKEDLFKQVLNIGSKGVDVFGSEWEGLPERAADLLLDPDEEGKELDDILIILHSAGSPIAGPMVRASIEERFHAPFAEVLGGEHAVLRSQLFGAILLGLSLNKQISGDLADSPEMHDRLRARIAEIIKAATAPL